MDSCSTHPLHLCLRLSLGGLLEKSRKDVVFVNGAWTTESYGKLNCTSSSRNTRRSTRSELETLVEKVKPPKPSADNMVFFEDVG